MLGLARSISVAHRVFQLRTGALEPTDSGDEKGGLQLRLANILHDCRFATVNLWITPYVRYQGELGLMSYTCFWKTRKVSGLGGEMHHSQTMVRFRSQASNRGFR